MIEILQFEFMRNALAAGFLASIICGVIGSLVVVNRIAFLTGGIAHAAYGGIGLAFFMGWPYLPTTLCFSLAAAMIMAVVTLNARHRADTIIGVLWSVGMATGIVLLDKTPGYHVDLMSYLFGSILSVPQSDLYAMAGATVLIIGCMVIWYHEFLAVSYDDEFARIRGIPVTFFYFLLIGMIAVSVVLIIQVVGLILVIALMTIPPYIAEPYAKSLWRMMLASSFLNVIFVVLGLWLAYAFNLTSGAAIILVAAAGFLVSAGVNGLRRH